MYSAAICMYVCMNGMNGMEWKGREFKGNETKRNETQ